MKRLLPMHSDMHEHPRGDFVRYAEAKSTINRKLNAVLRLLAEYGVTKTFGAAATLEAKIKRMKVK